MTEPQTVRIVCQHDGTPHGRKRRHVVATMVHDVDAQSWYDRGDPRTPVEARWTTSDGAEHYMHERTAATLLVGDDLAEPRWRAGEAVEAEARTGYRLRCDVCLLDGQPVRGERLDPVVSKWSAGAPAGLDLPLRAALNEAGKSTS